MICTQVTSAITPQRLRFFSDRRVKIRLRDVGRKSVCLANPVVE